jgi:hypothetical protein
MREVGSRSLSNADLARVLSPLALFVAHCVYLVVWSGDPFLKKWLDGSFSFFLALVLCNVIRARIVAAAEPPEEAESGDKPGHGGGDAGGEPPVRRQSSR